MSLEGRSFRASDDAEIGIYRAAASARGTHPGLIIFPSIFGVTDELVEHADQIAASGAVVVALDPFARSDDPGGLGEADRERACKRMGGIDFARVTRAFRASGVPSSGTPRRTPSSTASPPGTAAAWATSSIARPR